MRLVSFRRGSDRAVLILLADAPGICGHADRIKQAGTKDASRHGNRAWCLHMQAIKPIDRPADEETQHLADVCRPGFDLATPSLSHQAVQVEPLAPR